jgi:vacuolar-type H+-ATPase subunit I/STV1
LILGGVVWFFVIVGKVLWVIAVEEQQQIDFLLYIAYSLVYDFVIPGFLAFAIGGLLDYLLRPKAKPPLILGMMDKLCYIYAAFLILKFFGAIKAFRSDLWFVNFKLLVIPEMSESARMLLAQPLLGPTLAKVLLLVGIGMILHRLLPVIEESKSLV